MQLRGQINFNFRLYKMNSDETFTYMHTLIPHYFQLVGLRKYQQFRSHALNNTFEQWACLNIVRRENAIWKLISNTSFFEFVIFMLIG